MIPALLELNATTIMLDSEPIWPERLLDNKRNELMGMYHEAISKLVPEGGLDGKIFRMSVNQKTVLAPNGVYCLIRKENNELVL